MKVSGATEESSKGWVFWRLARTMFGTKNTRRIKKERWRDSGRKWTMEEATEDEPGLDWHVRSHTDDDCDQSDNILLIDKVGPSEVYNHDATY